MNLLNVFLIVSCLAFHVAAAAAPHDLTNNKVLPNHSFAAPTKRKYIATAPEMSIRGLVRNKASKTLEKYITTQY